MQATITIPGYELKQELGRGGMAMVYRAVQESLNRDVALKIMNPTLAGEESFKKRFLNEGHIIAQLTDPNIVTIFDIGVYEHHYYLAMEYLPGGTLKDKCDQGLPTDEAVSVARALGRALGYAHQQGFVHRDIKPQNVLFRTDGTPVLTDFGIAKTVNDSSQMTAAGYTLGSAGYMSPEQSVGKPLDNRSDIYSFGVMFWEMLTGQPMYEADDIFALAFKHATEPIPILPTSLASYQPIMNKLLAKTPEDRYANAEQFIAALDTMTDAADPEGQVMDKPPAPTETVVIPQPVQGSVPATADNASSENQPEARPGKEFKAWMVVIVALVLGIASIAAWFVLRPASAPVVPVASTTTEPKPPAETVQIDPPALIAKPTTATPGFTEPQIDVPEVSEPKSEIEPEVEPEINQQPPTVSSSTLDKGKPLTEAERRDHIAQLLELAQQQTDSGQHLGPPGDNAFETYRKVLELEPLNKVARAGLVGIGRIRLARQYLEQARQLLSSGDLAASLVKIEQGLRLMPDDQSLRGLYEEVKVQLKE